MASTANCDMKAEYRSRIGGIQGDTEFPTLG
jgi:hypothetical protein